MGFNPIPQQESSEPELTLRLSTSTTHTAGGDLVVGRSPHGPTYRHSLLPSGKDRKPAPLREDRVEGDGGRRRIDGSEELARILKLCVSKPNRIASRNGWVGG
jgi:hypothetical protein